jgi:uncharacterized membrane protein
MDIAPIMEMVWLTVLVSLVATVLPILLVVVVIVWAVRRNARPAEDPALMALKQRLARGEISPVEFEVRRRALERDD